MITKISAYIMPFVILIIVGYGMYKKSDNYDNFVNGAEDGMRTVVSIAPTLIGLMVAVGVLRASGFLDFIAELLSGVCGKLGIPASIVPLIIVRLFSSSAATGLSLDIFKQFGTDSYTGLITSILMGCTETVFYNALDTCWCINCNSGRHSCECHSCALLLIIIFSDFS